ncbi:MAG: DNA repair exonuclease [Calditrichaeota bacterium]|nr:DNA repair exonuclease [Calditrichota bacterium]
MKFLHAADLHLDSPLRGLAKHDDAPVELIRGATRAAFGRLVELAIDEGVDFVVIAGDLYDGNWQDFSTAIFLAKKLGELDRAGIRVCAVLGNHDAQSKLTKSMERPKNLFLFPADKPATKVLEDLDVAVHGQSFGQRHVPENLAVGYPEAVPGMFNIGLLHTSLDGRAGHDVYAPCNLENLLSRDYQYWALGHVHAREEVSTSPWVVYPGCLQGRHIRETGPKGCSLVCVEDGQVVSVEHHELDVVRWANCMVDLRDVDSMPSLFECIIRALSAAVEDAADRMLAVRITLTGATGLHAELQGKQQWLFEQIWLQAAEQHGDSVWIEKVVLNTSAMQDLAELLADDGSLGGLARSVIAVDEQPEAIQGLEVLLQEFRGKLPPELTSGENGLQLDDAASLSRLIHQAKDLLIGRLLDLGGKS